MNSPNENPVATDTTARIGFLEDKIAHYYEWFAHASPGVTPREEGHLGMMWAELDFLYLIDQDVLA